MQARRVAFGMIATMLLVTSIADNAAARVANEHRRVRPKHVVVNTGSAATNAAHRGGANTSRPVSAPYQCLFYMC
jgi:hypothetical protein